MLFQGINSYMKFCFGRWEMSERWNCGGCPIILSLLLLGKQPIFRMLSNLCYIRVKQIIKE